MHGQIKITSYLQKTHKNQTTKFEAVCYRNHFSSLVNASIPIFMNNTIIYKLHNRYYNIYIQHEKWPILLLIIMGWSGMRQKQPRERGREREGRGRERGMSESSPKGPNAIYSCLNTDTAIDENDVCVGQNYCVVREHTHVVLRTIPQLHVFVEATIKSMKPHINMWFWNSPWHRAMVTRCSGSLRSYIFLRSSQLCALVTPCDVASKLLNNYSCVRGCVWRCECWLWRWSVSLSAPKHRFFKTCG